MGLFDKLVTTALPLAPKALVRIVAKKYIAGETLNDAMATVTRLNDEGAMATVDVLGEFVESSDVARQETEYSIKTLDEIHRRNVNSNLSVKLTSLGLAIDNEFAYGNLRRVVAAAAGHGNFVRIDMENSPYTQKTIDHFRRVRAEFPDNVGIVLQAYLRRTEQDVRELSAEGANFRLCKGIYIEPPEISYRDFDEIRASYARALDTLLDGGCYVGIATHDEWLVEHGLRTVRDRGLEPAEYEFQMLLGVRPQLGDRLVREGHRLRIYVPFGRQWYEYSLRRLQENPKIAGYVAGDLGRSILRRR